jgi:hypothetical protein
MRNHDEDRRRARCIPTRRETNTKYHDEEKDEHEELRRGEKANYPSLTIVHDAGECI